MRARRAMTFLVPLVPLVTWWFNFFFPFSAISVPPW
jgi:hypothetical protein